MTRINYASTIPAIPEFVDATARCAGADVEPEWWTGTDKRSSATFPHAAKAKRICQQCPLRRACLTWAVEHGEFGIWGGVQLVMGREAHRGQPR